MISLLKKNLNKNKGVKASIQNLNLEDKIENIKKDSIEWVHI